MGLLKTLAKPAYEEVIKEMRGLIKSGAKPLYRHSYNPERLFNGDKFKTFADVSAKINTGVEPIGLYFSENIPKINPLLNPNTGLDTLKDIKSKYFQRGTLSASRKYLEEVGMSEESINTYLNKKLPYSSLNRGIITGVIPPDVKNIRFGPDEWEAYLRDFLKDSGYPKVASRSPYLDYANLPMNITDDRGNIASSMARKLTKRLLDTGADAVTFPDTVANQPDLYQTVLMTHGNMLAKWRKGEATGAGVLGLLATPKFFNWDKGHEQTQ
jgi:hypothetical protein